jgi:peptidoglycan/LPS O-acetylase OafA/YrhL
MTQARHYQPELDGLRALAVTGVLLCHLDFAWLPGGFVGVDIFFVLSGYLITGLISREIAETGRFRFGNFYMRRIRRLYPALLSTVVVTFVGSFLLLSPQQLRDFGSSAFAALLSIANFQFYLESGYFSALEQTKPLLHTWSLSVEEQFYLFWPVLLFGLTRLLPRVAVPFAIAAICAASLAISLHWGRVDRPAAFYMLPSRAIELGLGAMLVWLPTVRNKALLNIATVLGVVLMLVPMFLFTSRTPFPGVAVLLPCAGTLLFIVGAQSAAAAPFRSPPAVWLGRISYSLYLVHWPLIVLWTAYFYRPLEGIDPWLLLALSVALGWLQWRFIEQRFRRPAVAPRRNWPTVTAALGAGAVLAATSGLAALGGGWAWRIPADRLTESDQFLENRYCHRFNPDLDKSLFTCQNYRKKDKDLFVWGDSHARHLSPGLAAAYRDYNIYILHDAGCIPVSGFDGFEYDVGSDVASSECAERNRKALKFFTSGKAKYNVILTSAKRETPELVAKIAVPLLDDLKAAGNTALMLGDFIRPGWNLVDCSTTPSFLVSDAWRKARCTGVPAVSRTEMNYNNRLGRLVPGFVSINDLQCPDGECQFFDNGRILFRDDDHLNDRGSVLMLSRLKPLLPF